MHRMYYTLRRKKISHSAATSRQPHRSPVNTRNLLTNIDQRDMRAIESIGLVAGTGLPLDRSSHRREIDA